MLLCYLHENYTLGNNLMKTCVGIAGIYKDKNCTRTEISLSVHSCVSCKSYENNTAVAVQL